MSEALASPGPTGFVHPFSPAGRARPYSALAWLRENDPVFDDPMTKIFLVTRHADVSLVLRDRRLSAAGGQQARARSDELPASMLATDPPEHDRLRAPGPAVAGPAVVRDTADALRAEADAILASCVDRDEVDALTEIAAPFAVGALARLLGVPDTDRPRFAALAAAASANLDPLATGERAAAAASAARELHALLDAHAAAGAQEAHGLTRAEYVGVLGLSVVGGYEPLVHLVGNSLLWLLGRPSLLEWAVVAPDEELFPLVDEVLRLESPIPFTARSATEDVVLDTRTVPAGRRVLAFLSAANRDPEVFADPDELVVDRARRPHLAFGAGPHFCLGSHLVRRAGVTMLGTLLRTAPTVRAAVPDQLRSPRWAAAMVPRGLEVLRLRLR